MIANCAPARPAPMQCPTLEESITATLGLLPRGRAWPARDLGLFARYWQWIAERVSSGAPTVWPAGYVQTGFFSALGAVRNFAEMRLCDLKREFWCATQTETRDLWMAEYDLPNDCDPFPDLCVKVSALGGTRCEYYADRAARIGWAIGCGAEDARCGAIMGCDYMGDANMGGLPPANRLIIQVDLASSPAYNGAYFPPPIMGCLMMGNSLACEPDITPLICLLDRIVHAEVEVIYEIIAPPTYLMVDDGTLLATENGTPLITGN